MAEQDAGSDKVDEATHEVDERDAHAHADPDRMPTPEEERLADENELDPEVAESYKAAAERGANVKGEGSIGL
jgi:hypothetical protein